MKFLLLCVLLIACVAYVVARPQDPQYEIQPAILVHEEHNGMGSEGRAMNIPADILGIISKILETEIKK
jgi:hypothetical protein